MSDNRLVRLDKQPKKPIRNGTFPATWKGQPSAQREN